MIQLENLPPSENEKELQLLFNSQEYKNTVNRIDELSQNELNLISDDPKNNLYKTGNVVTTIIPITITSRCFLRSKPNLLTKSLSR